jgi:hypothetical protein
MFSSRCQEAEVTNGVLVSIWNVLGHNFDEFLERILGGHPPSLFLVLGAELDCSIRDRTAASSNVAVKKRCL